MCTQVSCHEISYFMYGQIWSMFPFHSNFIKVSCLVADIRHYVISLFCSGWQWLIVNDLMAKGARAICLFTRMFSGNFERIIDFGKSISGAFQCFSVLNIIAYNCFPNVKKKKIPVPFFWSNDFYRDCYCLLKVLVWQKVL